MNRTAFPAAEWESDSCPPSLAACMDGGDPCCVPDMGKMTLAVQWIVANPIEKFTLHGFWPGDCATGMGPSEGCEIGRTGTEADLDADPDLKGEMEQYWASSKDNNQWFWDHEWNKHGTCLSTVRAECPSTEEGPPHIRYFKASLRQYAKYDVYDELKQQGVVPRDEPYPRDVLVQALQRWGSAFKLVCSKGRLSQIYFYSLAQSNNVFVDRPFFGSHACPKSILYPPKEA